MDINDLDDETYLKLERSFLDKFIRRFENESYRSHLENEIDKLIYSYLKDSLSDIVSSKMGVKFSIEDIRRIVDESVNRKIKDITGIINAELYNNYNIRTYSINNLTNQVESLRYDLNNYDRKFDK
jgi:hypothetical protein